MEWYENPTVAAILGGAIGAVITGAVSLVIFKRTQKTKQLDCIIREVSSLLDFSDEIRGDLKVTYAGEQTEKIYLSSLEVVGVGTGSIQQQPIVIRLDQAARIVGYNTTTEPEEGFGAIHEVTCDGNKLDLLVDLINPGDRISIEILSLDNETERLRVFLKNAGVEARLFERGKVDPMLRRDDLELIGLAALGSFPLVGRLVSPFVTLQIARRLGRGDK